MQVGNEIGQFLIGEDVFIVGHERECGFVNLADVLLGNGDQVFLLVHELNRVGVFVQHDPVERFPVFDGQLDQSKIGLDARAGVQYRLSDMLDRPLPSDFR